jgi:hypothetical protein
MFTKVVLFGVIAACGVQSTASPDERLGGDSHGDDEAQAPADAATRDSLDRRMMTASNPDEPDKPHDEPKVKDQHFCCQSVDSKTFTGEGCSLITEQQVALCNKILYCEGNWVKDDGKVTCE